MRAIEVSDRRELIEQSSGCQERRKLRAEFRRRSEGEHPARLLEDDEFALALGICLTLSIPRSGRG
jgi:hypothetical protein